MLPCSIVWQPAGFAYREPAEAAVHEVVRALGLGRRVRSISISFRPRLDRDHGVVAWREGRRTEVKMFLDLGNLLTRDGRRALGRSGLTAATLPRRRYSGRTFRTTLYHELSHVADALRHGIDSNDVPRGRWGPFNEAWNVWIDGRLTRRGSPVLSRGERLDSFRLAFARRGRRRAHHRAVFNRLWRAEKLSQRDLLEAVDSLVG